MAGSTFQSENVICKAQAESFKTHATIVGTTNSIYLDVTNEYTIRIDPVRLVQQGHSFANKVFKANFDYRRTFNCRTVEAGKELLIKAYIYSYCKALYSGIKGPNIDFGHDNLVFRGHAMMYSMINNHHVQCVISTHNTTVGRHINLSSADSEHFFNILEAFPWLEVNKVETPSFSWVDETLEGVLFRLQQSSKNFKNLPGFGFSIVGLENDFNFLGEGDKLFLGNTAFKNSNQKEILVPWNVTSFTDESIIVNAALGITHVSTTYGTNDSNLTIKDNAYRSFPYNHPNHLLTKEVNSITGIDGSQVSLRYLDFKDFVDPIKLKSLGFNYVELNNEEEDLPYGDIPNSSKKTS